MSQRPAKLVGLTRRAETSKFVDISAQPLTPIWELACHALLVVRQVAFWCMQVVHTMGEVGQATKRVIVRPDHAHSVRNGALRLGIPCFGRPSRRSSQCPVSECRANNEPRTYSHMHPLRKQESEGMAWFLKVA